MLLITHWTNKFNMFGIISQYYVVLLILCDQEEMILRQKIGEKIVNRYNLMKQSYLQWVKVWTFAFLLFDVQNVHPYDPCKAQLFSWHSPPSFLRQG